MLMLWVFGGGGAVARAEQPVRCWHGWWGPAAWLEGSASDYPVEPWVQVPVVWIQSEVTSSPSAESLLPEVLEVEVRDAMDVVVAGQVVLRTFGAANSALERSPWWRPDAPLTPGQTYHLRAHIKAPPDTYEYSQCYYRAATTQFVFKVPLEPPDPSVFELDIHVETGEEPFSPMEDWSSCAERAGSVCESDPRVCCQAPSALSRIMRGVARAETLPGGLGHYAVRMTFDRPGAAFSTSRAPFNESGVARASVIWHSPVELAQVAEECVTFELVSFIADGVFWSGRACADPEAHVPAPPIPEPHVCDPMKCWLFAMTLAESWPEVVESAEVVEGPYVAEVVEESGPVETVEVEDVVDIADPSPHASAPGGCQGASFPLTALWSLCVVLLVRRSRHRGPSVSRVFRP